MMLSKQVIRLLICIIYLFSGIKYAEAVSLTLNNDVRQIHLHEEIKTLIDPQNKYTIDDIIRGGSEIQFSKRYDIFGKSYDKTVWAKFEVTSEDNKNWFLSFQPPWLDSVEFYLVDDQHQVLSKKVFARNSPFTQRDVPYRVPTIQFKLTENQHFTVYLKISNSNGVIQGIDLLSFDTFTHVSSYSQLIWGMVFGIYLLLVLGSIWFERASKDGIYLAFASCVFFCLLFNFILTGWWNQLVFPSIDLSSINIMGCSGIWLIYASIHFYFKYVEVDKVYPKISRLFLNGLTVFTVVYSILMLLGNQYSMIKLYLTILVYFIGPVSILLMIKPIYKSQSDIKKVFILSVCLYAFSFLYSGLAVLGMFQKRNLNLYINTFCEMLVFLSIFYSLTKKYQTMRLEKEAAQNKLLAVSQDAQIALEKLVVDKTKDLMRAQKELEKSLINERKAYQDQKNFVGMVSHELRTPLSIINASIQNLVRNKNITDETAHQKFDRIHTSVKRLTTLIDEYLNTEKLDTGAEKIECKWLPIYPLFEEEVLLVQTLFPDHQYQIALEDPSLMVWADKDILKLILRSLAENAAKYTPSGSTIIFNAEKRDTGCYITVTDNGLGIPEAEKPYVFDRYYRGSQSVKYVGTGLGLSLSRQLAELHDGNLVLLDAPNTGCCFRLFLPFPVSA